MNIFKILSSGDGSIKEPNVTAFLSYILDPNEGHGLNSKFLEIFLQPIISKEKDLFPDLLYKDRVTDLSSKSRFNVTVSIEKTVFLSNDKTRDLDILIEISDDNNKTTKYCFCVENKIHDGAIKKDQLIEQSEGIYNYYKSSNNIIPIISFIYLTKDKTNPAIRSFNDFNQKLIKINDAKAVKTSAHYFWSKKIDSELHKYSVYYQLQSILRYDSSGLIDPIHSYTKYTIKAFLNFIINDFQSYNEEKIITLERKKYKKPVREYYKDLFNSLSDNETISVKDAKERVRKMIKEESGEDVKETTLRCQLYLVTVNEKNRVHYSANTPLSVDKNLFYYKDGDRNTLSKFIESNNIQNIDIFWKEFGQVHQEKYSRLKQS